MIELHLELELDALQRDLKALQKDLQAELRDGMKDALELTTAEVRERTPIAFGTLRRGIGYDLTFGKHEIEGTVSAPDVPYAAAVEKGRRPGRFPNLRKLQHWVEVKLGITGAANKRVAFLVGRKIARFGTKGAFMFRDGAEAAFPKALRILQDAVKKALRKK